MLSGDIFCVQYCSIVLVIKFFDVQVTLEHKFVEANSDEVAFRLATMLQIQ